MPCKKSSGCQCTLDLRPKQSRLSAVFHLEEGLFLQPLPPCPHTAALLSDAPEARPVVGPFGVSTKIHQEGH